MNNWGINTKYIKLKNQELDRIKNIANLLVIPVSRTEFFLKFFYSILMAFSISHWSYANNCCKTIFLSLNFNFFGLYFWFFREIALKLICEILIYFKCELDTIFSDILDLKLKAMNLVINSLEFLVLLSCKLNFIFL